MNARIEEILNSTRHVCKINIKMSTYIVNVEILVDISFMNLQNMVGHVKILVILLPIKLFIKSLNHLHFESPLLESLVFFDEILEMNLKSSTLPKM